MQPSRKLIALSRGYFITLIVSSISLLNAAFGFLMFLAKAIPYSQRIVRLSIQAQKEKQSYVDKNHKPPDPTRHSPTFILWLVQVVWLAGAMFALMSVVVYEYMQRKTFATSIPSPFLVFVFYLISFFFEALNCLCELFDASFSFEIRTRTSPRP